MKSIQTRQMIRLAYAPPRFLNGINIPARSGSRGSAFCAARVGGFHWSITLWLSVELDDLASASRMVSRRDRTSVHTASFIRARIS